MFINITAHNKSGVQSRIARAFYRQSVEVISQARDGPNDDGHFVHTFEISDATPPHLTEEIVAALEQISGVVEVMYERASVKTAEQVAKVVASPATIEPLEDVESQQDLGTGQATIQPEEDDESEQEDATPESKPMTWYEI